MINFESSQLDHMRLTSIIPPRSMKSSLAPTNNGYDFSPENILKFFFKMFVIKNTLDSNHMDMASPQNMFLSDSLNHFYQKMTLDIYHMEIFSLQYVFLYVYIGYHVLKMISDSMHFFMLCQTTLSYKRFETLQARKLY